MTTEDTRSAYTAGLRQLADVLDAHPEIPLPYDGALGEIGWYLHGDSQRDVLAAIARGIPCRWDKGTWGKGDGFKLTGELAGLKLGAFATRDQVCTRVVTGVENREVEEVVTPAVTRKVTQTVEVVEWECLPLLAADASDVVDGAIEADPDGVADAVAEGIAAPDTAQPEDIPVPPSCSLCGHTGEGVRRAATRADASEVWFCDDGHACHDRRARHMARIGAK